LVVQEGANSSSHIAEVDTKLSILFFFLSFWYFNKN